MLELLELQRAAYRRDGVPSASVRKDRLTRLQALIVDHADELVTAMTADFGSRPPELAYFSDIMGALGELEFQKKHFAGWMKPKRRGEVGSRLRNLARRDPPDTQRGRRHHLSVELPAVPGHCSRRSSDRRRQPGSPSPLGDHGPHDSCPCCPRS
jgi:hypothetical protein